MKSFSPKKKMIFILRGFVIIMNKVKWPISGRCLVRSGLHAPSAKTNEPRALALQSLILLGILFQQEEVGVEDSILLGSNN